MKTHLPHRLRAALMAALASVSLTSAYGAAPVLTTGEYAIDWSKVTLTNKGELKADNLNYIFCPTIPTSADTEKRFPGYSPSSSALYTGSGSNLHHINIVRADSQITTSDIYFKMNNVIPNGANDISAICQGTKTANIYVRVGDNTSKTGHNVASVYGAQANATLTGNTYIELDDVHAKYTGNVYGASQSTISGSSTFVLRSGLYEGVVAAGVGDAGTSEYSIGGGTYLQTEGGTYYNKVVGGNSNATGTATINGGTHMLLKGDVFHGDVIAGSSGAGTSTITGGTNMVINGGTFNGNVIAGSSDTGTATITGGTHLLINGGTFNGDVYGGSHNATGSITGGVDMMITGGTFSGKIYGAGTDDNCPVEGDVNITITGTTTFAAVSSLDIYARGAGVEKVTGDINLTISGDDIKFGNAAYTTISLGADNGTSRTGSGKDTLTLAHLTGKSELAAETPENLRFRFYGTTDSTLVLSDVKASIKKDMNYFSNMAVKDGSRVTLDTEGNKTLGGATTVTVEKDSTLISQGLYVSGRDEQGATITKGSEDTLATATKIQDAKVAVYGEVALNTELENVDLVGGGNLSVKTPVSGKNTLTVSNGAVVNLIGLEEGKDVVFEKLTIGDKGTLRVFLEGYDIGDNYTDHSHAACTLTLGRGTTLVSDGDAKLVGNLRLGAGSILDYSKQSSMITFSEEYGIGWGSIEEHVSIVLDEWKYARLDDGQEVKLFGTSSPVGTNAYCMLNGALDIYMGSLDGEKMVGKFSIYTSDDSIVLKKTSNVPEPTTGTLSLLALAGLAARRRRKH